MNAVQRGMACNAVLVQALNDALEQNDQAAFTLALYELNAAQNSSLMSGVRQVAGDLQAALEQFRIDSRLLDLAEREIPDARHRLAHVLKLTDEAAHRTMDLIDQSCPLLDAITHKAESLLCAGNASGGIRNESANEMALFADTALVNARSVRSMLTDVLLTQGYQDLSGQIIRSVMKLVGELELALNTLVRIGNLQTTTACQKPDISSHGYGPVIPGVHHGNTVGDQQDVDAMLSGLGM